MSKKIDDALVLEQFFREEKEYCLREFARATNMNAMSAKKYLEQLKEEGLVQKKHVRNTILYTAKTDSEAFKRKKRNWNVEQLQELRTFLDEKLAYPTIILFGSYAKGENNARSDIDLCIITPEKKSVELKAYEEKLRATIHILMHTAKEFSELGKTSPELVNNIMNGIILSGYLKAV